MKNYYLLTIGLLLLLFVAAAPASAQVVNDDNEDGVVKLNANQSRYECVPGQVLLKFKDSQQQRKVRHAPNGYAVDGVDQLNALLTKYGVNKMEQLLPNEKPNRQMRRTKAYNGDIIQERDLSQLYCLTLSEEHAYETRQMIEELEAIPEIEYAEPNYLLHTLESTICEDYSDNPFVLQQWYLDDYGVKELWNKHIINPERPVIAIIDTGVDMTHPDLVDNLWTNTAEAEGEPGYDNDRNGFAGDVHGWDFINNTPNVRDFNMHGTHVAGIAAASNNGIGIIGANPQALIMPVSVMQSDGTGDVATIVKGINYAVQNGATVLNLSLGTYANSRALRQALEIAYQSAVIVAAAGNDGRCVNSPHNPTPCAGAAPMFPAAYSFVLGVQATQEELNPKRGDYLTTFSNYDDDGNSFSCVATMQDPDGFNYELKAPGSNILSTIPGGKYKVLQGTSMAAPLVAGAISALKMVKPYDTQEILWGDLLHTDNIAQAFAIENRPAELDMLRVQLQNRKDLEDETEEDYSGDNEIDAGEIVSIYPVIRTTFGEASNIQLKLEMGDEFEDHNIVQILTGEADFGMHLDAYGKGVSLNPLVMKIANDVANNRFIKMKVVATCDESSEAFEKPFVIVVTNMVKISGLITEDRTLTADHVYYVNENFGIMEGTTLTIEPGTRLEFAEGVGLSSFGKFVANGTPEKPIVFTGHNGAIWAGIRSHESAENNPRDVISFCKIEGASDDNLRGVKPYMYDCLIIPSYPCDYVFINLNGMRNTITGANDGRIMFQYNNCNLSDLSYSNIVNNNWFDSYGGDRIHLPTYSQLCNNNYINNYDLCRITGIYHNKKYWLANNTSTPNVDKSDTPSYLGTSREDIVRPYVYEIGNAPITYGQIDLSNMRITPIAEAHGIVWKVVVNGKDAQDEFEELAPLGVGRHKFEIYFNRPMNKEVAPQISFGVRDPYTQNAVAEDGIWNEEGTIYTAYKTITGKTKSDGVNRIYVRDAEDNEFFEIPYEKTRFNIIIQAAGSMATGFMGEAGLGKVSLTWNNENNNFEDAMGFNVYRYSQKEMMLPVLDEWGNEVWEYDEYGNWVQKEAMQTVVDTIRINQEILDIESTEYVDYDVVPGETYYYFYKVLSTDLQEYDVSNVVAVTPLTASLGDANGSGGVDVADVITTVNYAAGMDPKPFIFEAADMNTDNMIDILDVIGIIQTIVNPSASAATASIEATAIYTIEDGVLYVESPVDLAGVQAQLNVDGQQTITVAEDLDGFEHTSAWLSDNDYLFLAYNMNGKTLSAGKHALLYIGDANLSSLRLSDALGHNVMTEAGQGTPSFIDTMGSKVMKQGGVFNLKGQKVAGKAVDMKMLPKGVYIINGQKVVK